MDLDPTQEKKKRIRIRPSRKSGSRTDLMEIIVTNIYWLRVSLVNSGSAALARDSHPLSQTHQRCLPSEEPCYQYAGRVIFTCMLNQFDQSRNWLNLQNIICTLLDYCWLLRMLLHLVIHMVLFWDIFEHFLVKYQMGGNYYKKYQFISTFIRCGAGSFQ